MLMAFTAFHVALSLIGIASGFVVLSGMLTSQRFEGWTKIFLTTTVATSLTGFLFPYHGFTPGIAVGIISVVVLTIAALGLYRFGLAGGWRKAYTITSILALYLNVFVLIVQLFEKVPFLNALAPTQSEPPFQIAQIVVLLTFAFLGFRATSRFVPGPRVA